MPEASPPARPLSRSQRLLLAALGLGYVPVAPGTFGALGGAVAIDLARRGAGSLAGAAVAAVLLFLSAGVTLALAGRARNRDGGGDPGWVVADEVAGQALASGAALAFPSPYAPWVAFALFRLFDVLKPGPVAWAERWPGGLGVLADDLVAGLFAAAGVVALGITGALG